MYPGAYERTTAPEDDPAERSAAATIVDDLHQHPLGLTIAAGSPHAPPSPVTRRCRNSCGVLPLTRPRWQRIWRRAATGYAKPLSATLTRSFEEFTDAGRDVLAVTSVLGPATIPTLLVDDVLTRSSTPRAEEGLHHLRTNGLADDLGAGSFVVHALVSRAARIQFLAAQRQRLRDDACEIIGDALEAGQNRFDRTRSAASYLPHVLPLTSTTEWPSGQAQWHVLNEASRSHYELGDTAGALHSFQVLSEQLERLEEEHTEMLTEIVQLAVDLDDQESAHGLGDPQALRAKAMLAHALGAADQLDGQLDAARAIANDSRDGLEEAAARHPDTVKTYDLSTAEAVHH